jgi:hypothetical protein
MGLMQSTPNSHLDSATTRLKAVLREYGLPSEYIEAFADEVYRCSVEQQPWSSRSLLAIKPDGRTPLNLNSSALPTVTYYNPVKAAECAVSTLSAILHAENPLVCGVSVLSAYQSLRGLRIVVTPAEALVFSIVYTAEGRSIPTSAAKARFCLDSEQFSEISGADFEWACQELRRLGCLLDDSGTLKILGRVVVRD